MERKPRIEGIKRKLCSLLGKGEVFKKETKGGGGVI